MSFQSPYFLIFFTLVFGAYFAVKPKYRWIVLLIASYGFYPLAGAAYLLIPLVLVTLATFWCGNRLDAAAQEQDKQKWMIIGIVLNSLVLLFFKIYPLVTAGWAASDDGAIILSAVGVSFYVFQAISYIVDLYLGKITSEKHLGIFALYFAFFPKVLQGPIERGRDFLPQLHQLEGFSYEHARAGALQFAYGLFKKVVIADRLGVIVDPIYGAATSSSGPVLLFATFVYAFQLYYDFSGYTDMALGIARVFNIRLTNNFTLPYLATSVAEFWRRWHISFSRWIMDYWFKPIQLALRRWGAWGSVAALLVTFFLSGLWHGVSLGFVLWGLCHGLYLSFEIWYTPIRMKLYRKMGWEKSRLARAWQVILTFCLVSFSWVFFRANTTADAFTIVNKILPWRIIDQNYLACGQNLVEYLLAKVMPAAGDAAALRKAASLACQIPRTEFSFFPGDLHLENLILTLLAVGLVILLGFKWQWLTDVQRPVWFRWTFYLALSAFIFVSILFLQIPNPASAPFLYGIF